MDLVADVNWVPVPTLVAPIEPVLQTAFEDGVLAFGRAETDGPASLWFARPSQPAIGLPDSYGFSAGQIAVLPGKPAFVRGLSLTSNEYELWQTDGTPG